MFSLLSFLRDIDSGKSLRHALWHGGARKAGAGAVFARRTHGSCHCSTISMQASTASRTAFSAARVRGIRKADSRPGKVVPRGGRAASSRSPRTGDSRRLRAGRDSRRLRAGRDSLGLRAGRDSLGLRAGRGSLGLRAGRGSRGLRAGRDSSPCSRALLRGRDT